MKRKVRIAVDLAMTLGLLVMMGYHLISDSLHEWIGAGMFALFILHHCLNIGWWKSLFSGKYTPLRVLTLAIDLLVLASMLGLMVSGVILSQHVFDFLPISGGASFARLLHMASAYWGYVLMAAHLGLHWGVFLALGRKATGLAPPSSGRKLCMNLAGAAVAVYGAVCLVRRGLVEYMLVRTHFVFFDFDEPMVLFYLDYLAIMGLFIFLAHLGTRLIKRQKGAVK